MKVFMYIHIILDAIDTNILFHILAYLTFEGKPRAGLLEERRAKKVGAPCNAIQQHLGAPVPREHRVHPG